jgi:hypothetical protein
MMRTKSEHFCWSSEEQPGRTAGMFARHLIEAAVWTDDGLRLAVRLNWYRALPVSCVERLEISLDGAPLDPRRITLEVGGRRCSIAELAGQDEAWWHVPEACRVSVDLGSAARPDDAIVELLLGTRIPYLVGPGGDAVVIVDRATAAVTS